VRRVIAYKRFLSIEEDEEQPTAVCKPDEIADLALQRNQLTSERGILRH
jgi:hypothetical protein